MSASPALRLPFDPASSDLSETQGSAIDRALKSVRAHLGMEIAYVSEFVGDRTVFRQVDAPGLEHLIKVGDSHSLDDVYCRHILEGRLPNLMADTSEVPFAAAMPITSAVPIGKHMSIPLRLADGEVYGMFCCLGPNADRSLNDRDLQTMKVFAEFAAHEVRRDIEVKRSNNAKIERIAKVMRDGEMSVVYQPICNIKTGRPAGFECLTRFSATPYRTPDVWFNEASEIDCGPQLEMAAIQLALAGLNVLPNHVYLGINASPGTIVADGFAAMFDNYPLDRIVLEVTEHAEVANYAELTRVINPLRKGGIRLAIDDAGAGYSGLQHILKLQPDLIKLDLALTRNIDADLARRALALALVNFADATDCEIIAEGVETASELDTLRELGVQKAQGYFLGRPATLADALCSVQYGLGGRAVAPAASKAPTAPAGEHSPASIGLCAQQYGSVR